MSNKFGEFWYIPTIDKDGFDIHSEIGIVDWEATSEKAIANCQRRYIKTLESALAPFADAVNDGNILLSDNDEFLLVESKYGYPAITHNGEFLCVSHLRAAKKALRRR